MLLRLFIIISIFSLCYSNILSAADVTLAWDANSDPNIAGYKIYYKTSFSGPPYNGVGALEGDSPIIIPLGSFSNASSPEYMLHDLSDVEVSFFVVTAYDLSGNESAYSNEVFYNPDGDGDGMADWWEMQYFGSLDQDGTLDVDHDGLIDLDEFAYDTDPNARDTDGDVFSDGVEVSKGTDPNDPNSHPPRVMPWLQLLLGD